MIKLMDKLPRHIYVACSGGVDSMAALDFLRRNHQITVAYFDHAADNSRDAFMHVEKYCADHGIPVVIGTASRLRHKDESLEEYWREERYAFFDKLVETVVVAHHLDDAVETWLWGSINGQPKLPELRRGNVIRPFLCTRKEDLVAWCENHSVTWVDDTSNTNLDFTRNYIRRELMPHVLKVNPGIHKTIKKRLQEKHKDAI